MGSWSDESIYWILNNRNYIQLSLFRDCRNYNTHTITILSRYNKVFNCGTALSEVLRLTDESLTNLSRIWEQESELYYDRRSVGQSVLVPSTHLGLTTRFLWLFWQLQVCWCRAPYLTKGRVCLLLCTMYNIFTFYMLSCVVHSLT
jgi:hypothetical protein